MGNHYYLQFKPQSYQSARKIPITKLSIGIFSESEEVVVTKLNGNIFLPNDN